MEKNQRTDMELIIIVYGNYRSYFDYKVGLVRRFSKIFYKAHIICETG